MGMLDGHVALITGGAGGLGLAAAKLMQADGAQIMLADIDAARLQASADGIGAGWVVLDVTSRASWTAAVDATLGRFGTLTVLVNGAGISEPADIETLGDDAWERHIAINLSGVVYGMQAATPAMKASGKACSMVNIASMLSQRAGAIFVAYCASKTGMVAASKAAALHFAKSGIPIRVNTVHPGAIRTPMYERYIAAADDPAAAEASFAATHPMGRVGEPNEVAEAILFLASSRSSFTTGAELPVDGAGAIRD